MKSSENVIPYLVRELLKEQDQFENFLKAINKQKLIVLFRQYIENNDDEDKIKLAYKSKENTYKTYKSNLKCALFDYLRLTHLESDESKMRRTLDIIEISSFISNDLLGYCENTLRKNLETFGSSKRPALAYLMQYELANVVRRSKPSNWTVYLKEWDKTVKTLQIAYNRGVTYYFTLQSIPMYIKRGFVRTKFDYDKLLILKKELYDFHNVHFNPDDEKSTVYYQQAKRIVESLLGNSRETYNMTFDMIKNLKKIEGPKNNSLYSNYMEQCLNLISQGLYCKIYKDFNWLIKDLEKFGSYFTEKDKSYAEHAVSMGHLIKAIAFNTNEMKSRISDVLELDYTTLPKMYEMVSKMTALLASGILQNYVLCLKLSNDIIASLEGGEERLDFLEMCYLYKAIFLFELNKNRLDKVETEFQTYLNFIYNKFRRKDEDFAIFLSIVKTLKKMNHQQDLVIRKELFEHLNNKIKLEITPMRQLIWDYYHYHYDIENWIEDNISFYS